jgi:DNA-3-methyladenine glycosylase I
MNDLTRCPWANSHPLYVSYHDQEWGVPVHDDRQLFEMLALDGAQAGLSWLTILRKREAYRQAFDRFDPRLVAGYAGPQIERLMANPGLVRNRRKIEAVVHNARAFLAVQAEFGSFDAFILYRLVDLLPERDLDTAEHVLRGLLALDGGPVLSALLNAPEDDEPVTQEEEEAVRRAREDLAAGRVYTHEEAARLISSGNHAESQA